MRLNDKQWGTGTRVAVLLHGMMGSSESWHRVAPVIAQRGYRVIALDLPGHGGSERDPNMSIDGVARDVSSALAELGAARPDVAIGHSFGGTVLAAALVGLQPQRAIFVDAPMTSRGGWDRAETAAEYFELKAERTVERLRATRPHYSTDDCEAEGRAARDFDPETAAGIAAGNGGDWTPDGSVVSLMIRADPSEYVSDDKAAVLRSRGVEVRDIVGASHSIWYSHFDEFMTVIDDWL